jgi:6-phospho-beta-glucosidase
MKLALIGGGGVRAPLFVASALRRADRIGLDEICLMDIDAEKLAIFGALCREVARAAGSPVRITSTTDARAALEGARYVVTTIRVGGDEGRVFDERIALRHGVLGQETTGPGGFAMALRSIPAVLGYAELLDQVSPGAWTFNFTNPAGLVTQALHDNGFHRTVGICDAANEAQLSAARWLKVDGKKLRAEVFGLNHLSWARRVMRDDQDVLAPLLRDPGFLSNTMMNVFDRELVEETGMWMNEYLYYFHYAERAVSQITADERTRGEEIRELNRQLLKQLNSIGAERHPQAALNAYYAYENRRSATYMHYARPDAPTPEEADERAAAKSAGASAQSPGEPPAEAGEGYAGVALSIVEALETGTRLYTALNVPNEGAINCLQLGDVVEVSCEVSRDGIRPLPIGDIPEAQELLICSIKRYERLTVEAIMKRSRSKAILALMAHPLVLSYSRAQTLVDEYLVAHASYVGTWQ